MSMQLPYSLRNLHAEIVRSLHGSHGKMTVQYPCDFTDTARAASGNLAIAVRGPCECTIALRFFFARMSTKNRALAARSPLANARCLCRDCAMPSTTCIRATVLRFLKILSNSSRNQIVEAAEPVNPHDNLTASAQRLRGKGGTGSLRAP